MNDHLLRISAVQSDVTWEDRDKNLTRYEALLRELDGQTDVAVLPELFTTGSVRHSELADTVDGETVSSLKTWANSYHIAIAGSFMATENMRCFNRSFFITPEGEEYYADKRHLFRMGGEDRCLEAGNKRLIVPYRGWNICLMTCYDLRFPVWSRNTGNAYDLLVYAANWPAQRKEVWETLLCARAMENMSYVCGVNRIGVDGQGIAYHGRSLVYSPQGEKLLDAGEDKEILQTCLLEKMPMELLRIKFPVWQDADSFILR
jgi:predicted amidohydrolase